MWLLCTIDLLRHQNRSGSTKLLQQRRTLDQPSNGRKAHNSSKRPKNSKDDPYGNIAALDINGGDLDSPVLGDGNNSKADSVKLEKLRQQLEKQKKTNKPTKGIIKYDPEKPLVKDEREGSSSFA